MNYEIIGLVASIFVLTSFIPKDVKLIRCINIVGCVIWVIYGLIVHGLSVWLMNLLVMIIHIYHLIQDRR